MSRDIFKENFMKNGREEKKTLVGSWSQGYFSKFKGILLRD